jgi:hypothetical protein
MVDSDHLEPRLLRRVERVADSRDLRISEDNARRERPVRVRLDALVATEMFAATASTSRAPSAASLAPGILRASATASAGRSSAFEGMQA